LVGQYRPDFVLIEKASTGTALGQELRGLSGPRILMLRAPGDKEVRFAAQSAVIEQGRVWLPQNAPWLSDFLKELLSFPGAKHDDQVDSVELFLRFANNYRRPWMQRAEGREERARARPTVTRPTPFNARRYLDNMLRRGRSAPSVL
jgi:predicted phage terminase large subunit-like protein